MDELNIDGLNFDGAIDKYGSIELTSNASWANQHSVNEEDAVKIISFLRGVFDID